MGPHTPPQKEVCLFKVNVANKDEEAKESEGLSWKMLQEREWGMRGWSCLMSQVSGPGMTAKGGFLALCRKEFKSEP